MTHAEAGRLGGLRRGKGSKKVQSDFTHDELSKKIGISRVALMTAKVGHKITTNQGAYKKIGGGTGATWKAVRKGK